MFAFLGLSTGLPCTGEMCFDQVSTVLSNYLGLCLQRDEPYSLNCWEALEFKSLSLLKQKHLQLKWTEGRAAQIPPFFTFIFRLEMTQLKCKPKSSLWRKTLPQDQYLHGLLQNKILLFFIPKTQQQSVLYCLINFYGKRKF